MKKTILINLLGAPGAGKSTFASLLFAKLKEKGVCCEYVDEFAKGLVWEGRDFALNDQLYLLANQNFRILSVLNKVNVIITDSPIILSLYYNKYNAKINYDEKTFNQLILECHNRFDNLNYYLERNFPYENEGRSQTEEESKLLNNRLKEVLFDNNIPYTKIENNEFYLNKIVETVLTLTKIYKNYNCNHIEYERKFLINNINEFNLNFEPIKIKQIYLDLGNVSKRIRCINDNEYIFTEKINTICGKQEFEVEISKEDYEYLAKNYQKGKTIVKDRYLLKDKSQTLEINLFFEPIKLNKLEIEFDSIEEMNNYIPPKYDLLEVTQNKKYSSLNISMNN